MESLEEIELPSPLMVITDRARSTQALPEALVSAAKGGARWIRVREPDLDLFSYISLCHVLIDVVADPRVTWAVRPSAYAMLRTAYPELRLSVHCAERDPHFAAADVSTLVGRSVHGETFAASAVRQRSSTRDERAVAFSEARAHAPQYLLLAPVFATESKPGVRPAGIGMIREVAQGGNTVVALGGITPANVSDCVRAGARAVAVCGDVLSAADPGERVRALLSVLSEHEEILR